MVNLTSRCCPGAGGQVPFFFKQDSFNGRLFLYNSSLLTADQGYECPATLAECSGLERAAVWDPEHVVDRLRDHAAGRPNQWVESLKINIQAIPA
jgi:hypothetical protein